MYKQIVIFNATPTLHRADGGKGTISAQTLGPENLDDLKAIQSVDAASVKVEYGGGGLFVKNYYLFEVKTGQRSMDAALTRLYGKLGLVWTERYAFCDNNGGVFALKCSSRAQGHSLAAATIALVALANEVGSLSEQSYTILDEFYGQNAGHRFYAEGEYAGVRRTAEYVVPFDMDAYYKNRERLAQEATENLERSQQDRTTAENNNTSATLNLDTEQKRQQTAQGKTLRYLGIVAVAALVVVAVVVIVKRKK